MPAVDARDVHDDARALDVHGRSRTDDGERPRGSSISYVWPFAIVVYAYLCLVDSDVTMIQFDDGRGNFVEESVGSAGFVRRHHLTS